MKRTIMLLAVGTACLTFPLHADYSVNFRGEWPQTWPAELEPLRAQATTYEGPLLPALHYAIPFADREQFESAWPHILAVKTPGAPIILKRGSSFWLRDGATAGVCIHTPPEGSDLPSDAASAGERVEQTIYIELIIDGEIVDLNRIPLPRDTPIVDERFPDAASE